MSASVPWSVNAVEPETWAAARDAARRSGLSVGEWLDTAIRECSASSERPRRSLRGADPLEQRLDDIAERLDHFSRNSEHSTRGGRADGALYSSIESLNERIDQLMRDRTHDRNAPLQVSSAIQRLDDRIEELFSRSRISSSGTSPDLERKLENISRTIEVMSRKLEHENVRYADYSIPPTVAELDAAVADIMMRQSVLDGTPMPQPYRQRQVYAQMPLPPAPDFSGIENQLKNLTEEMTSIRRSTLNADSIDGLRREVSDLASTVVDLAPRRSLEAIERAVETLVNRIDQGKLGANAGNSAEIAQTLEEIRQAIAGVRPAESFASVERDLVELSAKLDALNARSVESSTVTRLQEQTAEIREMLASALPTEMLKGLCLQIETLVRKFEMPQVASNDSAVVDVMAAFDRRIEALSERIDSATKQTPATPDLGEIRTRLDDLMHSVGKSGQAASSSMDAGLRALSDKLDAAESRLAVLGTIEKNVKELFAQMQEARSAMPMAAPVSEPVPQSSDYADRPAKPAIREDVPARSDAQKEAVNFHRPSIIDEPLNNSVPAPAPAEPAAPPPHPMRAPQVRTEPRINPAMPRNDKIIDLPDDIPADFPLEPGSGAPRHRASQTAAQRVAQSEAALGGIGSGQPEHPARATDYIAAARRAAQSAAAEPANDDKKKFAASEEPKKKTSGLLVTRGRQAFFVAITAFLLIFTAMRYFDGVFPGFSGGQAPKAAAPQSVPAEPAPAPQKNSAIIEETPSFLTPAPAGIIGPQKNISILGEARIEQEPETTGSVKPVKPAAAPVQTASVPAGREANVGKGDELPVTIGSQGLRAAASSGDPIASYEIGSRYLEGRGVQVNTAEAINWFERAIKKGSAPAAYRIGGMHEKGQGIAKNSQEAKRFYVMAAEAGHIKAMHNLAVLYSDGVEGAPDYKTAARWFRMAAERGVADSQYNLGVLYARGLGVDPNLTESYRWFALAAAQGDQEAGRKRDDVAKRLDNQSLVAAKLAVQTWTSAPVNAAANSTQLNPEWEKAEAAPARRRAVKK